MSTNVQVYPEEEHVKDRAEIATLRKALETIVVQAHAAAKDDTSPRARLGAIRTVRALALHALAGDKLEYDIEVPNPAVLGGDWTDTIQKQVDAQRGVKIDAIEQEVDRLCTAARDVAVQLGPDFAVDPAKRTAFRSHMRAMLDRIGGRRETR